MDTLVYLVTHALLVLFAIGMVGCVLVIPATAAALIKAIAEADPVDERHGAPAQPPK